MKIWKKVATDLEQSTRRRRVVNLYKLEKNAKPNETVVIPGKVLATGELSKKITIAAFEVSEKAKEKIKSSGSSVISLFELLKKNPKGSKVRVLG